MEKEQLTLPEHRNSPPFFIWGSCCSIFDIPCSIIWIIVLSFFFFSFGHCTVLVRITASGSTFDIFELFLLITLQYYALNIILHGSAQTRQKEQYHLDRAVMPQSITYQRQNIINKISTQKLLGNYQHLLVHAQCIHYQYNLEQELLTNPEHLYSPSVFKLGSFCSLFSILCCASQNVVRLFHPFFVGHCIICPSSVCAF